MRQRQRGGSLDGAALQVRHCSLSGKGERLTGSRASRIPYAAEAGWTLFFASAGPFSESQAALPHYRRVRPLQRAVSRSVPHRNSYTQHFRKHSAMSSSAGRRRHRGSARGRDISPVNDYQRTISGQHHRHRWKDERRKDIRQVCCARKLSVHV